MLQMNVYTHRCDIAGGIGSTRGDKIISAYQIVIAA